MKFTWDGQEYEIEFERYLKVIRQKTKPTASTPSEEFSFDSTNPYTTARVFRLTEAGKELVRGYTVGCHHRERRRSISHEAGRKAALRMALYDAPIEKSNGSGEAIQGKPLTREFRAAVWAAYHGRPGSRVQLP